MCAQSPNVIGLRGGNSSSINRVPFLMEGFKGVGFFDYIDLNITF